MMSTPAFRYAAALYRTGCPVERLCETADYLTDSPPLWEALCSPVVEVREKTAVLARLPSFTEDVRLQHFYALLAEKGRFPLLPDIVGPGVGCPGPAFVQEVWVSVPYLRH